MMTRSAFESVRLGMIVLFVAACFSPTEPLPMPGTFVVTQFAGHELPAVIHEGLGSRVVLLADTLRLDGAGRGERVRWYRIDYEDEAHPTSVNRSVTDLTIARRGGTLRAREHVLCAAGHATETCSDLWDLPVAYHGHTLRIGVRTYSRLQ